MKKKKLKKNLTFNLTLIVPNLSDTQMIMLILQDSLSRKGNDEESEEIFCKDYLHDYAIINRIRQEKKGKEESKAQKSNPKYCPFCEKDREFNEAQGKKSCAKSEHCSYFVVYAYRMVTSLSFDLACLSKQRGGVCRLLSTNPDEYYENSKKCFRDKIKLRMTKYHDKVQADFGVLVISNTDIFFL